MSLIRLNPKSIIKIIILIVFLVVLRIIFKCIYQKNQSSLDYDYSKREFVLQFPKGYFKILPQKRDFSNYVLENEENYEKYWTKFQIKSVKFEYSKIFLQDWVPIFQEIVNLGANTIEIEIVWNVHEKISGSIDLKSNNLELDELIKLVKAFNLFLLVRIDPFLPCSDFDMGGLPNWLLVDEISRDTSFLSLKNEKFIQSYQKFLDSVLTILAKYQFTNNGPIIGLLIQSYESNHLDTYQKFYDSSYRNFIFERLNVHGIVETVLKSISLCELDRLYNFSDFMSFCDPNLFIYLPLDYKLISKNYQECISCNSEYKDFEYFIANENIKFEFNLKTIVLKQKSFGIKKFFCYTNYGFETSSKDKFLLKQSNCLLDQIRSRTEKYDIAFQVIQNKLESRTKKNYSNIVQNLSQNFLSNTKRIYNISITHVLPFKNFVDKIPTATSLVAKKEELYVEYLEVIYNLRSTSYGYILYRLEINLQSGSYIIIKPNLINDYAVIKCDYGNNIFTLEPGKYNQTLILKLKRECNEIQILIEIFERSNNFSLAWNEFKKNRKGILEKDAILFKRNDKETYEPGGTKWKINLFDFLPKFFNRITFGSNYFVYDEFSISELKKLDSPLLLYAKIYIQKSLKNEFVYLIIKNLNRGIVFLNGFNLGKYSTKSNIDTLFVPKNILNNGSNEILIFDLHGIKKEFHPKIFITKEFMFI